MSTAKIYHLDLASGLTSTSAINLKGIYGRVYLDIPTFPSGGTMYVLGSDDNVTFRRVYTDVTFGGVAAVFQIAQGGNSLIPIPPALQHYKIELTTGVTDATTTFGFVCSDTTAY